MASQLRAIRRKTPQVATIAAGITALATTTAVVIHRRQQHTQVTNSDQKTLQTFCPALQIENGFILIGHMRTSTAFRTITPVTAVGGHSSERHIGTEPAVLVSTEGIELLSVFTETTELLRIFNEGDLCAVFASATSVVAAAGWNVV